jgi:single-strand DNA-binding protein
MNKVILQGRLAKAVELRYTQSGTAVGSFSIAVASPKKDANGNRQSDFFNATVWNKAAENFANFTTKGSRVVIEGRLHTNSYQNKQGATVYSTEVVVENFELLDTKAESEALRAKAGNQPQQNNQGYVQNGGNNNVQRPANQQQNGYGNNGQVIDINDDDLPF